jgi:hypothetical protein
MERRREIMSGWQNRWIPSITLFAVTAALSLSSSMAAHAASPPPVNVNQWSFFRPNLQISSYLSEPFEDPVTHAMVRHLSFTVFNAGPVACGANTTMMQLEVGDPASLIGTAISMHPLPNPGMSASAGWVYHMNIPDGAFVRVDLWADYFKQVSESNEGDNHAVQIRPFFVFVPY